MTRETVTGSTLLHVSLRRFYRLSAPIYIGLFIKFCGFFAGVRSLKKVECVARTAN